MVGEICEVDIIHQACTDNIDVRNLWSVFLKRNQHSVLLIVAKWCTRLCFVVPWSHQGIDLHIYFFCAACSEHKMHVLLSPDVI